VVDILGCADEQVSSGGGRSTFVVAKQNTVCRDRDAGQEDEDHDHTDRDHVGRFNLLN